MKDNQTLSSGNRRESGSLSRNAKEIRVTVPGLLLLAALVLIPCGLVVSFKFRAQTTAQVTAVNPVASAQRTTNAPRASIGHPGPWGNLELVRIDIEPPEEFFFASKTTAPPRWFFRNLNADQVTAVFQAAGATPAQLAALTQKTNWTPTPGGITVSPDLATLFDLAPETRARIYATLSHFPENGPQTTAHAFDRDRVDEIFIGSGISRETFARFKKLIYPGGNHWLFADEQILLDTIPTPEERLRFSKALARKRALLVRLRVDAHSNLDDLVRYWGYGGRDHDIRPLLESLARVPGGGTTDILHLLPQFVRTRLNTFPLPVHDPQIARRDCHWTSFNFFNEQPDDSFLEPGSVKLALDAHYHPVAQNATLGDILIFLKPNGEIAHSAVYLADDVVFTKNGSNFSQPWIFMSLQEVLDFYNALAPPDEPLKIICFHRHDT